MLRPKSIFRGLVLAGPILVAACGEKGSERPYFTQPPQIILPSGARTNQNLVAVCYSSLTISAEALRAMVGKGCENPQMVRQDLTGFCTLVQPVRATFACSRVDAEVAKVERPFGKFGEGGRFRSEPLVPGDAEKELER